MNTKSWITIVLAVMLLLLPLSLNAEENPRDHLPQEKTHTAVSFSIPTGTWLAFTEKRQHESELVNAFDAIQAHDFDAAQHDLELTESFLKIEEGRATPKALETLKAARASLKQLRKELKSGNVGSLDSVRTLFAQVDYTLARHNLLLAEKEIDSEEPANSGYDLLHYVKDLKAACDWATVEVNPADQGDLDDLETIGGQLRVGESYDPTHLTASFATGEKILGHYASTLSPPWIE